MALTFENFAQRAHDSQHVSAGGPVTHQPDAPRLALEVPKPAANLNTVVVEQAFSDWGVLRPVGNPDGVEHREVAAFLADVVDADLLEAGAEQLVHRAVALEAIL